MPKANLQTVSYTRLFDIIAARIDFTEDTVYAAMGEAGVPRPVADRAYKFTQIACGRALLGGLGVRLSPILARRASMASDCSNRPST